MGYFNASGLNLLDINGNYNNIYAYFTQTGNSLLLCSNNTMIDAGGNLNVFEMTTYTKLGIPTGTGGTWLPAADTLNSNTSDITVLSNNYTTLLLQLSTISGNVANIANIANYHSGLQSSLPVTDGVFEGDKFEAKYPLVKMHHQMDNPLIKYYYNLMGLSH